MWDPNNPQHQVLLYSFYLSIFPIFKFHLQYFINSVEMNNRLQLLKQHYEPHQILVWSLIYQYNFSIS